MREEDLIELGVPEEAIGNILDAFKVVERAMREQVAREIEAYAPLRAGFYGSFTTQGRADGEKNGFAIAARLARGDEPARPNVETFRATVQHVARVQERTEVAARIAILAGLVGSEWPEVSEALHAAERLALGQRVPLHEWETEPRPEGFGQGPPPVPSWEQK